jgi:hypothetical protein
MTEAAKMRRDFRHSIEAQLMHGLSRTAFGRGARVGQIKSAARKMAMQFTSGKRAS